LDENEDSSSYYTVPDRGESVEQVGFDSGRRLEDKDSRLPKKGRREEGVDLGGEEQAE